MKTILTYLVKLHPVMKLLLYIQLLAVSIQGALWAVIFTCATCFILVKFYPGERGSVANPYFALIFCAVAVLIVLPGGTRGEIIYAAELSARILAFMLASAAFGLVTNPVDIAQIADVLHLPYQAKLAIITLATFLPLSLRSIHTVVFAQRSRGLDLGFSSLLRRETYIVLIVPYIASILRSAFDSWISMNLRPWSEYRPRRQNIRIAEVVLLFASFILWIA